jgi:hypothetical protein
MDCEQEFKPQQPKAKKHLEYVVNQGDFVAQKTVNLVINKIKIEM